MQGPRPPISRTRKLAHGHGAGPPLPPRRVLAPAFSVACGAGPVPTRGVEAAPALGLTGQRAELQGCVESGHPPAPGTPGASDSRGAHRYALSQGARQEEAGLDIFRENARRSPGAGIPPCRASPPRPRTPRGSCLSSERLAPTHLASSPFGVPIGPDYLAPPTLALVRRGRIHSSSPWPPPSSEIQNLHYYSPNIFLSLGQLLFLLKMY